MNDEIDEPSGGQIALVHYLPGDLELLTPGDHVLCAVTGQKILIEHLRYWNAERQEAYATAEIATRRHQDLHDNEK